MKMTKCHYCHKAIRGETRKLRLMESAGSVDVAAHPLCVPLEIAPLCTDLRAARAGDLVVRSYGPPTLRTFDMLRITRVSDNGWLYVGDLRFSADGRHFSDGRYIDGYHIRAFAEGETPDSLAALTASARIAVQADAKAAQDRKIALRQEIARGNPALMKNRQTVCTSPLTLYHVKFSARGNVFTYTYTADSEATGTCLSGMLTAHVEGTGAEVSSPQIVTVWGDGQENALLDLIALYW